MLSISSTRVVAVALSLAVAQAAAAPARAAESVDVIIDHGVQLRRAGDDEGALREFQRAYDQSHTPRAAAQLGLAEQALGRWADADTHVTEALRTTGDSWVEKNRPTLNGAAGTIKGHIGRIEISASVAGAVITVNRSPVGAAPLPGAIKVSTGVTVLRAEAPGYAPATREITVGAGEYVPVMLTLEPLALGAGAGAGSGAGVAGGGGQGPVLVGGAGTGAPPAAGPVWRRPWFWGVTGAGVVAAVLIVVLATRSPGDPSVDVRVNGN